MKENGGYFVIKKKGEGGEGCNKGEVVVAAEKLFICFIGF